MLDMHVRIVLNKIVISFWCNSHGGHPHCLWSAATVVDSPSQDEFASAVSQAASGFYQRFNNGSLRDLTDECLA